MALLASYHSPEMLCTGMLRARWICNLRGFI